MKGLFVCALVTGLLISEVAHGQGSVSGPSSVCLTSYTAQYTVSGSAATTGYTWSVGGGSVASGQGTKTVTVTFFAPGLGRVISVTGNGLSASKTTDVYSNSGAPSAISGSPSVCPGTSATFTISPMTMPWMTQLEWIATNATITAETNSSVTVSFPANYAGGDIVAYAIYGDCGAGPSSTKTITATALVPAAAGAITGTSPVCPGQNGVAFSVGAIANASGYTWTMPGGATIASGSNTNSITVNFSSGYAGGTISVYGIGTTCGNGAPSSLPVGVVAVPASAGTITGTSPVCPGQNAVAYSVPVINNATGYTWTLPTGATIASGANTRSITVNFSGSATSGNVSVYGTSCAGNGASSSLPVTVTPLPAAAGTISGSSTVCEGTSMSSPYSVAAIANATSYQWVPSGGPLSVANSTNNTTFGFIDSYPSPNVTVTVKGVNSCGTGIASPGFTITVNKKPGAAGTITGTSPVCPSQTGVAYSVPAITNALTYSWSMPTGATIASGAGTNSITVNFSSTYAGGTISVSGVGGSCGSGTSSSFPVALAGVPAAAGTITGTSTVCKGQNGVAYSVPAINNATGYNWVLPSGATIASGSNTRNITVNFSASAVSGNITVNGTSCTGNGATSTFPVTVTTVPGAAGTITGSSIVCEGTSMSSPYSVAAIANATSYQWVPTGGPLSVANSTNNTTFGFIDNYPATSITVTVSGVNVCGTGTASPAFSITIKKKPAAAGAITGTSTVCPGQNGVAYSVGTISNALTYLWGMPTGATIASGANTNSITVNFSSTYAGGTITVAGVNGPCPNGASASFPVAVAAVPGSAGTITGTSTVCKGQNGVAYSVPVISNATGYNWTLPAGVTIAGGANTGSITVNFSASATSGNITVNGTSCSGNGATSTFPVTVTSTPGVAGTITGSTTVCEGVSMSSPYSVAAVPNATSYQWIPTGGPLSVANSTNNTTFGFIDNYPSASVSVTVSGVNVCGTGTASPPFTITVYKKPATPEPIKGSPSACGGQTGIPYSVTGIANASSYYWTMPSGASIATGANTYAITVDFSPAFAGGAISVAGIGGPCGSGPSSSLTINLPGVPAPAGAITGTSSVCPGQENVPYSVPVISNAIDYIWTLPDGASITSGDNTSEITVSFSTSAVSGNISVYGSSCKGNGVRSLFPVGVIAVPTITAQPVNVSAFPGDNVALSVTASIPSGTLAYQWRKAGVNISGATGSTLNLTSVTSNDEAVYDVVISTAGSCPVTSNPVYVNVITGEADLNSIITRKMVSENVVDESQIPSLTSAQMQQSTVYFDGISRRMQEVLWQQSPSGKDIVKPTVYDAFGREKQSYLPFGSDETNGIFKEVVCGPNGDYISTSFYDDAAKVAHDNRPFSETIFEASPFDRPWKVYGAGSAWAKVGGADKFTEHGYLINIYGTGLGEERIIAWMVNGSGNPIRNTSVVGAQPPSGNTGYYPTGSLTVRSTKDENGNETREYSDNSGRVVLKKSYFSGTKTNFSTPGTWVETYYIYDDLANLRYVLQPELSKVLSTSTVSNPSATQLNNLAFQYKYDAKKRMTEKRPPNADPVYMVYDNRDRVVLTQDGNQRAGATNAIKYWSFTKYDELNRPVLTGIKDTTTSVQLTQADMQSAVDAFYLRSGTAYAEAYVGSAAGNVHGYSNKSYPVRTTANLLDIDKYLTVTYYDNYSFKAIFNSPQYDYNNNELTSAGGLQAQRATAFGYVNGQVTGTKVRMLSAGTWLKSVNYYDDRDRLIQKISENVKGHEVVTRVYDFTGRMVREKSSLYTGQAVNWTALTNATVSGDVLTGTSSSNWAAGAASSQTLAAGLDGWVEYSIIQASPRLLVGLSDQNTNASNTTIDYGWDINGESLKVYENGAGTGATITVLPGDVVRVERINDKIYYKRNGIIHLTSTVASTTLLMADVSFFNNGARVGKARLSPSFSNFTAVANSVTRRFVYDQANRVKETWHTVNTGPEVLLALNEYNEIGQLVTKGLHITGGSQPKQRVDYRYNIRGWLSRINNSDLQQEGSEAKDLFGMELFYNETSGTGNSATYNGNISATTWSTGLGMGTVKEMAYNFSYDPLNRLTAAGHQQSSVPATWVAGQFDESGFVYDLNGNIKNLQRKGKSGALIDDLVYDYGTSTNQSNRLLSVTDQVTNAENKSKGFLDGSTSGDDYTYDPNGNMKRDKNKGIVNDIVYNHLNLPEVVQRTNFNSVRYSYDATGVKHSQVYVSGNSQKVTEYVGSWGFENGEPQFIQHEEGRIVLSDETLVYSHSFNNNSGITASSGVILTSETINGENYMKVTGASGTSLNTKGAIPMGGTFQVQAGQRYKVRVKGYRDVEPVYVHVESTSAIVNHGAHLPIGIANESWVETTFVIPAGTTTMTFGLWWNSSATTGATFSVNEIQLLKLDTSTPEYQYHLKDHLGNVRLTFTTKTDIDVFTAGLEMANAATEQAAFNPSYDNATIINATIHNHTGGGSRSQRLSAGNSNEIVGLARSVKTMPGDVINVEVWGKYLTPTTTSTQVGTFILGAISSAFGVGPASVGDGAQLYQSLNSMNNAGGLINSGAGVDEGAPKAYLNYILFDENYLMYDFGFDQISTSGLNAHEWLHLTANATKPGYAYFYLSNENAKVVEVYFDDFKIEHVKGAVVSSQDYYPFGLTYNSFSRESAIANPMQYNGKEFQDELGLGWLDYGARFYDASISRWTTTDPLAEKYMPVSPYAYVANNPVHFKDPNGKEIWIYYQEARTNKNGDIKRDRHGHIKYKTVGVQYKPGGTYTGNNKFVANAFAALDRDRIKGADAGIISDLASRKEKIGIVQGGSGLDNNPNARADTRWRSDGSRKVVWWDQYGAKIERFGELKGYQSASTLLLHELAHGKRELDGEFVNRSHDGLILNNTVTLRKAQGFKSAEELKVEEQFIIDNFERPAAVILGETSRLTREEASPQLMKSSTSTLPKEE
ncbi:MAG TPA: DUF6443 domain-containing protein [Cyclobacteriaceae bacterium]|nr:DUF6443 domain-containing protein [Cyclobacteriaceae bacterium]